MHTICELIEETIRQRSTSDTDNKREIQPLPHYLVIVQDRELIKNEKVNEKKTKTTISQTSSSNNNKNTNVKTTTTTITSKNVNEKKEGTKKK